MKPKQIPGIPQQKNGSFHDTEKYIHFENSEITDENYEMLKNRFFSINQWENYCGKKSAEFKLHNPHGAPISRLPQENDLIRIKIPGPGNPESNGYEWVKIEKISNQLPNVGEIENITMICIPTKVPGQNKSKHIAHFYSEKSTSNFRISKGLKFIKIGIYGRNETPNMNTSFIGKMRNSLIGIGGMFGISKIQWKIFAEKIIEF